MATGSKKAVLAAMGANLGIAIAKFGGAAYTGSSAMLAEGVHSLVDTGNQLLLLFGMKRSARPADRKHPFGYSREIYFWSFVVAVLLFTAGGVVAIYEGVQKLNAPHPVESPVVNYVILCLAMVMEGGSFRVALGEFRKVTGNTSWWRAVREAKDPVLFTVLFEDTAALIGLAVALAGLVAAHLFNLPALDGVASLLIGLILIAASLLLARETMSLIIGESASPALLARLEHHLLREPVIVEVRDMSSVHLGPHDIVVTALVDFRDTVPAGEIERIVGRLIAEIRAVEPDVKRLFLAPTSFAGG
ncbi:cation diffusion facilitator family transporter [Allosphingosinicella vermicomposti]|uniref:cation diffusion facilitator family transporter n=1 Tax=Allosphingosinicella vermicomposti TaxID=614671 RepID=UPI000D101DBC|nr:cation diffusion facilitator family transporter [Allosphingosinicella vermicomposti]